MGKKGRTERYTKKVSLRVLHEMFGRSHTRFERCIISLDESNGLFFKNEIRNVIATGVKDVFNVRIRTGYRRPYNRDNNAMACTSDHKLLTHDRGWVELRDLRVGERIAVASQRNEARKATKGIQGQKSFRDICWYHYRYECVMCDWQEGALDVNHLYANRTQDNSPENLCFMCPNHHRIFTEKKLSVEEVVQRREAKKLRTTQHLLWAEFLGYEHAGQIDTYDITVAGPNHNFLAGNFVVHNCLNVVDEAGISVTEHYCRRKNGLEEAIAAHPLLEGPLKATFALMLYQEQMMRITAEVAAFSKAQQGAIRRAAGKKDQTLMSKMGLIFVEEAVKLGKVTREEAERMFEDIRKSARYNFNKSHAISYGLTGIETAWFKAHLPVAFFAGWLSEAKGDSDPRQEMMELVGDARMFGVKVTPPDAREMSAGVSVTGTTVRFGLSDARGAGDGQVETLARLAAEAETSGSRPKGDWSWAEWLGYTLAPVKGGIKKNVAEAWVGCGAFDFAGVSRTRMQKEYSAIAEATEREVPALRAALAETRDVAAALTRFADVPRKEGGPHDKRRRAAVLDAAKLLTTSASSDADHPTAIAGLEEHLLGVALTCSRVDGCDRSAANWTCRQFNAGVTNARMVLAVEVKDVRAKRTKKGDAMAYLTVDDGTDSVEATAFPDAFAAAKSLLYAGNCVVLEGRKDKKFGSFVVDKAFQLIDRG